MLVVIAIIGILASLILPALSRGLAKAKRISCLNNVRQVGTGLISFSLDNEGRLPWQLTFYGRREHFGGEKNFTVDPGSIFGCRGMKQEITTPKILWSPCDGTREPDMEIALLNWEKYSTRENPIEFQLILILIEFQGLQLIVFSPYIQPFVNNWYIF